MKYKNKLTGATIETNAVLKGANWEVISEKKEIKVEAKELKEEPKEKKKVKK